MRSAHPSSISEYGSETPTPLVRRTLNTGYGSRDPTLYNPLRQTVRSPVVDSLVCVKGFESLGNAINALGQKIGSSKKAAPVNVGS